MDNSFLEIFKMLGGMNGNQMSNTFMSNNNNFNNQNTNYSNRAKGYYPNDFNFNSTSQEQSEQQSHNQPQFNQFQQDNMLPFLMSMLGKGKNPLASILGQNKEDISETESSPQEVKNEDDILIL